MEFRKLAPGRTRGDGDVAERIAEFMDPVFIRHPSLLSRRTDGNGTVGFGVGGIG